MLNTENIYNFNLEIPWYNDFSAIHRSDAMFVPVTKCLTNIKKNANSYENTVPKSKNFFYQYLI